MVETVLASRLPPLVPLAREDGQAAELNILQTIPQKNDLTNKQ